MQYNGRSVAAFELRKYKKLRLAGFTCLPYRLQPNSALCTPLILCPFPFSDDDDYGPVCFSLKAKTSNKVYIAYSSFDVAASTAINIGETKAVLL